MRTELCGGVTIRRLPGKIDGECFDLSAAPHCVDLTAAPRCFSPLATLRCFVIAAVLRRGGTGPKHTTIFFHRCWLLRFLLSHTGRGAAVAMKFDRPSAHLKIKRDSEFRDSTVKRVM